MKFFCDTSVLVAGCVRRHPHFNRAHPLLEAASAGKDACFISAHSVAEFFAVLTKLPVSPRINPVEARLILENNVLKHFKLIDLTPEIYAKAVSACVNYGMQGGAVYDALLLECARVSGTDRIYTFNLREFQRLAPDLVDRLCAP